jgi:hypothetical protein
MIRRKHPMPHGWKPVPEFVSYKGKKTRVQTHGDGVYYKDIGGEVVLVNIGPEEVTVSCTAGISKNEALRYAVEICSMEVGDAVTLL